MPGNQQITSFDALAQLLLFIESNSGNPLSTMIDLIKKKKNGSELSRSEYAEIINGFISGEIPDYQVSAFLMAVCFQGMCYTETADLTEIMMHSGDVIDLSGISGIKVDKHSTGGVGDKTSLVLGPLVAAAGVPVPKMSGRGLGHTGGTLDKLESIPGLSVDMSSHKFIENIKDIGIAICGQNKNLVPADEKLYALRGVTGTVDNISLISSSIMSKKLACGTDAIIIDIKVGEGAYMKNVREAEELANMLIAIGSKMNKIVRVVISAMYEPLGNAIGNALEVKEAIQTLKGNGPSDLTNLCLELGSHMLVLGKICNNFEEGLAKIKATLESGSALEKFKEMIGHQGGDVSVIDKPELLPIAKYTQSVLSSSDGYVSKLNALEVGLASVALGAGRETKDSIIEYGAGITLDKKVGDYVKKGEVLAVMHTDHEINFAKAKKIVEEAYIIGNDKPNKKQLILKTII